MISASLRATAMCAEKSEGASYGMQALASCACLLKQVCFWQMRILLKKSFWATNQIFQDR